MHTNESTDGYVFSVEEADGEIYSDLKEEGLRELFSGNSVREEDKAPAHVETNKIFVSVPDEVPVSICKDKVWDEYDSRCIGCGRCTLVCPTCTCFTMEDIYYSDNGKVGERRRVHASCMIDGYSNVAGGGEYRKKHGERMRFKVLHKISDFKKKFGYQMCVGCGRCDMVCPEYISFSECINKVDRAIRSAEDGKEAQA
jgi:anaerobic sulfite reductase subunit A